MSRGLGGVFRGQVWMPDGNPNYYSPSTFMRRVGLSNIWRGGVPRRHRSTIFPSVYSNMLRQKADILVTHEAPSCHKKGFAALDRLSCSLGVRWFFHGHQHEDRAYGLQGAVFTRAVGYQGIVNLQGEVVISAKLDPREEAALHATDEWKRREMTDPIIVRDEDGHISLLPPGMTGTPAILPVMVKLPTKGDEPVVNNEPTPQPVSEPTSKVIKESDAKVGKDNKRQHRSSRSRIFRDRRRRQKKQHPVS